MPPDPETSPWLSGAAEVQRREEDHQEAEGEGKGVDFALVIQSLVLQARSKIGFQGWVEWSGMEWNELGRGPYTFAHERVRCVVKEGGEEKKKRRHLLLKRVEVIPLLFDELELFEC